MIRRPPRSTRTDTLFPYTTLFRSNAEMAAVEHFGPAQKPGVARLSSKRPFSPNLSSDTPGMSSWELGGSGAGPARRTADAGRRACQANATDGNHRHDARSEERRVGKKCDRTCRSRGSPYH